MSMLVLALPVLRAQHQLSDLGRPDVLWSEDVSKQLVARDYVSVHDGAVPQMAMPVIPDKTAYAFLLDNQDVPEHMGMVSFQLLKPDAYTMLSTDDWSSVVYAGIYIDDTYYAYIVRINLASGATFPERVASFNFETGEWRTVCELDAPGGTSISDFAYDHSTGKLYATQNSGMFQTTLYEFSLEDGSMTPVCVMNGTYMMAIACTYEGEMYGIGTGGGLYKIDTSTGGLTLVGNTGYMPWYVQSMEFDHTDNTLYWAGADAEHTFLATVDVTNAATVEIGVFEQGCNVTGLYVPFTRSLPGTPGEPLELVVMPGQKGELYADLQWTNPLADPFGDALSGTMGIKIYNAGEMVADITGKAPGEKCSYRHNGAKAGEQEYRIVMYNDKGTGEDKRTTVWIGEDYPGAPCDLSINAFNGTVQLSWDVPDVGVHGGWVNKAGLTSSVWRQQDNALVMDGETAYDYVDAELDRTGLWSYRIVVADQNGNEAEAVTDTIVAGPGLDLPLFEDFQGDDAMDLWTVHNANGDALVWEHTNFSYDYGARYLQYIRSYYDSADDYVIAPPVKLYAGRDYRVSFDAKIKSMHLMTTEKLRVFVSHSPTLGAEAETVGEFTLGDYDTAWGTREFVYSPAADGVYYIGIYLYSDADQSYVCLDNVRIEELFYYDLEVTALNGPHSALAGMNSTYEVTVHNKGSMPSQSFQVRLVDGEGTPLTESVDVDDPLQPDESATFQVVLNPDEVGDIQVYANIVYPVDGDQSNNTTAEAFVVSVLQPGDYSIKIGEAIDNVIFPFMQYNPNTVWTQSIYLASEINSSGGLISKMEWYGGGFAVYPASFPVKIYLANTDKTELASGTSVPTSEMTLVYEGVLTFADAQQTEMPVEFTTPFLYDGSNLAVHIERGGTGEEIVGWDGGFSVFYPQGDMNVTLTNDGFRQTPYKYKPVVTVFIDATGNSVGGRVTDTNGAALPGVDVTITENGLTTTTGDDGSYAFDLVNQGIYNIEYSLYGYEVQVREVEVSGEQDQPVTVDVELAKMETVDCTVAVNDGVNPVGNAQVRLEGYESRTATTGMDGNAVFEDLVCGEYSLSVEAVDYEPYASDITVSDGGQQSPSWSCELLPVAYMVDEFSCVEGDAPQLAWQQPVRVVERRYDDGVPTTRAGSTPDGGNADKAVFGIIEENPGTLKSVSWYLVETEGKTHRTVNLHVFKRKADGSPESAPDMTITGIESTVNGWYSYTLDEPYTADESFYVALSCSDDYLGLGVDGSYFNPTPEYPNREMLQYYSYDYTEQFYYAAIWYKGNFMIRLSMADQVPQTPASIALLEGYNVYRFLSADRGDTSLWTQLETGIGELSFVDDAFASLPQGYYQYAVTALWRGTGESEPAYSAVVAKDMATDVTIRFTTDVKAEDALDGTSLMLVATDGSDYEYAAQLSDGARQHTFTRVSKGTYRLTVVNPRFETLGTELQPDEEDAYAYDFKLDEKLTAPVNLTATEDEGENGLYHLQWNLTSNIFEDFESHEDFALNSAGDLGWTYLDNDDNQYSYGLSSNGEQVVYDNWGARAAYIIFNPTATEPRCDADGNINAYSGDKFLGSFSSSAGQNDDFIISPELFFDEDFAFSFYARSYTDSYGTDRMMAGYSLTDTEPESFIWLNDGGFTSVPAYMWSYYSYTVPAAAKYVAIRCVSNDSFLFMVDDISIGSGEAKPYGTYAESFEVYLDGAKVAETTDNAYALQVGDGQHVVGVKAIYETGESELAQVTVGGQSSISEAVAVAVTFHDKALWLDGVAATVAVYSADGVVVVNERQAEDVVDLSHLSPGVYVAVVVMDGERHIVKFII